MDLDKILLDLEVIRQVNEYDKLAVCVLPGNTELLVDSTNLLSGFYRWYYGYDRDSSIKYVEQLTDNIDKATSTITLGNLDELGETLKKAITNALPGLDHLKNTYTSDSVINAKLVLCINKLNNIISSLDKFLTRED